MFIALPIVFSVVGALVGLAVALAMPVEGVSLQQTVLSDVVLGLIGALIGGFTAGAISNVDDLTLLICALMGAVILVGLLRLFVGNPQTNK